MPSKRRVTDDLTNHYNIQTPDTSFDNKKPGSLLPDDTICNTYPSL